LIKINFYLLFDEKLICFEGSNQWISISMYEECIYIILSSYICNYIRFIHLSCSINHLEVYVHNRLFVLIQRHICVYILVGAEHLLYIQWKSIKSIVQYVSFCNYMCSVLTKREGSFFFSLIIIHQRRTMEQINICMRSIVSVTLILDMLE
jgi:hypothetical protein